MAGSQYQPPVRFSEAVQRLLAERRRNTEWSCTAAGGGAAVRRAPLRSEHAYEKLKRALCDKCEPARRQLLLRHCRMLEHIAREYVSLTAPDDATGGGCLDDVAANATLALMQIFQSLDDPNFNSVPTAAAKQLHATFGPTVTGSSALHRRAMQAVCQVRYTAGTLYFKEALSATPSMLGDVSLRAFTGSGIAPWPKPKPDAAAARRHKRTADAQPGSQCGVQLNERVFGDLLKIELPTQSQVLDFRALDSRATPVHLLNELAARQQRHHAAPAAPAAPPVAQSSSATAPTADQRDDNFRLMAASASAGADDHRHASRQTGKRWKLTFVGVVEELGKCYEEVDALCSQLFAALASSRTTDQLQMELIDLLGVDKFDLLAEILNQRNELVSEWRSRRSAAQPPAAAAANRASNVPHQGAVMLRDPAAMAAAAPNSQFSVQSEHELAIAKAIRREERKLARRHAAGGKGDALFTDVEDERQMELQQPGATSDMAAEVTDAWTEARKHMHKYPYIFDPLSPYSSEAQVHAITLGASKLMLPESTVRTDRRMYEEICIPAQTANPPHVRDPILISELDQMGRKAFSGIKSLNRIQSIVFDAAYKSKENLLICAPTGAGKTNIAMLAVLQALRDYSVDGVIQKHDIKIVYLAPMKALAAEMAANFGRRLAPLGVAVRELTGDMQLTRREIQDTQMLIVTPEKWDVVTRKATGDVALAHLVRLLIIDEVHLLHDDRGAVIEVLVARTLRQSEMKQSYIRIVGLSATLPNYFNVADFLRVSPHSGLFFFDGRFRPVPLTQTFIGVKGGSGQQIANMDEVTFEKALKYVRDGHQVLVFVHARNATGRLAQWLAQAALNRGEADVFRPAETDSLHIAKKAVSRSRNRLLQELFPSGLGVHHAGMLRADRLLSERLFADGHIRLLCCTATLAWGVNLPAHAVIIRGTDVYDSKHGAMVDLGILDVQQIFGRAGRPQYDTTGEGVIITGHDRLYRYLSLLTRQAPIESQLMRQLADNMNAEIVLGTVTNVEEAVRWLNYTYLFVRAQLNPMAYGLPYNATRSDPLLFDFRTKLVQSTAAVLDRLRLIRYNESTGTFRSTDLGRIASHYYIKTDTVEVIVHGSGGGGSSGAGAGLDSAASAALGGPSAATTGARLREHMTLRHGVELVCAASEFADLKVRDDELNELDALAADACPMPVAGGSENVQGKVNILLQSHISRRQPQAFSLISDQAYVVQNAGRIARGLFEMALVHSYAEAAAALLTLCRALERQCWPHRHPFNQLAERCVPLSTLHKLDMLAGSNAIRWSIDKLLDMDAADVSHALRVDGRAVIAAARHMPRLKLDVSVRPITRTILQVNLTITADYQWDSRFLGKSAVEPWYIWVENPDDNYIYHHEYFAMFKRQVDRREPQHLQFTIPISEKHLPSQYIVAVLAERWLGCDTREPVSFHEMHLPEQHSRHTDLLNLRPLHIATALGDPKLAQLYNFEYFNAVQTQIFHCLYHTDRNALVCAPTGSGKTVAAELAILRALAADDTAKCVYIAPMKALVRERMNDWRRRLQPLIGRPLVEMTGDVSPDIQALKQSALIVTTPEKWDGVSRSWQSRDYVRRVRVLIVDEIHLLGSERGAALEVLVARMNYMAGRTGSRVRILGLSTALANADDMAAWLGIEEMGLYNFRPSVRPVPTEVHIQGFAGKHYCPRMATMNKPAYLAVREHSAERPALVFVSSRRQTHLTAVDLMSLLVADNLQRAWVHCEPEELEIAVSTVRDHKLKLALSFGIGVHHAGLCETDRNVVEKLFAKAKIQVLVTTATLAWGVNFPAHLVVVKGTEYYDGKVRRYVDMPVTDVLQMVGRAGRPQFDDHGVACVFVHDVKKAFYKKFLYEPFPVESHLGAALADHLNAEVAGGSVKSRPDAVTYLTWTYYFRRLLKNPTYYGLASVEQDNVNVFLSRLIDQQLAMLQHADCVQIDARDGRTLISRPLGRIASYYYLSHGTVHMFRERIKPQSHFGDLLKLLCDVPEYAEIPVRHNEELINAELQRKLPIKLDAATMDSPHTKAHLLYQAHISRATLPSADYATDTKSVLDQCIRIVQAMLDACAELGYLPVALHAVNLMQAVVQARWPTDPPLSTLPHMEPHTARLFKPYDTLPQLYAAVFGGSQKGRRSCGLGTDFLIERTAGVLEPDKVHRLAAVLQAMPRVHVHRVLARGCWRDAKCVQTSRPMAVRAEGDSTLSEQWTQLHADQDYVLSVELRSPNAQPGGARAHAARFPKHKDAGWVLVLGVPAAGALLAVRRVPPLLRPNKTFGVQLDLRTPKEMGRALLVLYVMSDAYLGIDTQAAMGIQMIEPDIECQLNTEVEYIKESEL